MAIVTTLPALNKSQSRNSNFHGISSTSKLSSLSMAIRSLDASSIHALTSGQVVTSLASAVKELLENSLDAGATSIDIRLLGAHGTSGFSVSDNGCGIPASEYDVVAKKHYTSKLASFDDLATVRTFGFRGEALASVCALSEKVTITTAVEADAPLATVLELDNAGNVLDRSKKVARQVRKLNV